MERALLKKNDLRGETLYKELINNNSIQKDYFEKEDQVTLENYLDSSFISLESNRVKLKIIYKLRKHKLSIFDYYDISQSYFNQNFYNMKLMKEQEDKINKYL